MRRDKSLAYPFKIYFMIGNVPSKKKINFEVIPALWRYLKKYNRTAHLPLQYDDLLRYNMAVPLLDLSGTDTLWETVFYPDHEQKTIFEGLKLIYALLKTDGDVEVLHHLTIARIDYCNFGNSKPFRVRIINRLNDNYDHFYVKKADASRIYGLELEELLSPNSVMYLADGRTLIEEHIAGVPGDDFMKKHLTNESEFNQIRIAKEFIKFNERCFVRLLGDMRSYNYVVDITPDIEGNQYRMRAIDFDQQSYEGWKRFYQPQHFKENNPIYLVGKGRINLESMRQYQLEERSLIAVRLRTQKSRVSSLFEVMIEDQISKPEKIENLCKELAQHHKNNAFLHCHSMGEVVLTNLRLVLQKDFRRGLL